MIKKQNALLISLLVTVGLFIYLTIHHYAVKLGLSGNALCSISEKVNCDAAALSRFAEIFQVPVALLGAVFHSFLLGTVIFDRLGWVDESPYLRKTIQFMLAVAAGVSVIMAVLSFTVVQVLCPFCFATYIFSFINLYLGWNLIPKEPKEDFKFGAYFGEFKSHLILLAFIPATSWIFSGMLQEKYGLAELNKLVPEKLAQWRAATPYEFDSNLGLRNSVASNKIVLVEFADFKCPHCRSASQTIETFLKGRTDVQFIFKPFPLDGACNSSPEMQKGDGSRCTLAGWALCAEKQVQKGWAMHHWIFERQDELQTADLKSYLPELEKEFGLKGEELMTCAQSGETYELLKKSSAEGNRAQVAGTPTIYLNGKKLSYGHIMEVLRSAVAELQ